MKFPDMVRVITIALGFLILFLFKPSNVISQSILIPSQPNIEPTYKVSQDFGVVVESKEDNLLVGYFVAREGKNWVRFESETAPRAIPANP